MKALLPWVALGGALGAMARHGLDLAWPVGVGFPWTTLLINLVGSLLLALLPALSWVRRRAWAPAFVGTGVLGGFTTMSTFSEQTRALLAEGRTGLAAGYLVLSVAGAALLVHLANTHVVASAGAEAVAQFEAEEGEE